MYIHLQPAILVALKINLRLCLRHITKSTRSASISTSDAPKNVIKTLLIANRGEIACRVIRTARKMGIETVAVYSEVDSNALHVKSADRAFCIGGAQSQESYLHVGHVLEAAKYSGAQAVHPGYGFLSENAEFAEKCSQKNLIFVGPPPSAIRSMGLKNTAKQIMSDAGVPIIQGYHGSDQSDNVLKAEAERIGYPVMLKAVRGGGGKGMRIVKTAEELLAQLESARRESLKAFGDDQMIVEKFVVNPRHVEVQVFGDSQGNYVHLFERDCSVQRRHQKIVEEAPAPAIDDGTRHRLGEAARRAAAAVGYVGAGTVEFVMNQAKEFFFMEMNTRLQVEHPVTEMITGFDLVEWQLRVAQGEPLPVTDQNLIRIHGHSFEARVYAEEPENEFLPGAGPISYLNATTNSPLFGDESNSDEKSVRIETGVREGDEVSVFYDPMIAKLVVWAPDRSQALKKLHQALSGYKILGLKTNIDFLRRLISHSEFKLGNVYTNFIQDHHGSLFPDQSAKSVSASPQESVDLYKSILAMLLYEINDRNNSDLCSNDPFDILDNFRINLDPTRIIKIRQNDQNLEICIKYLAELQYEITMLQPESDESMKAKIFDPQFDVNNRRAVVEFDCELNGQRASRVTVVKIDNQVTVLGGSWSVDQNFEICKPKFLEKLDESGSTNQQQTNDCLAPMPGVVEKILVQPGSKVDSGDPLVVMVAMKMEYVIKSPGKRTVDKVLCKVGGSVPKNAHLITFVKE